MNLALDAIETVTSPFKKYLWLGVALALAAALAFTGLTIYRAGRADGATTVQQKWDRSVSQQQADAITEQQAKARESFRRLEAQDANQHAQDQLLARMRRDRDDAVAAADRVREQSAAAARDWAERLADSPTAGDIAAAGDAIRVLTNVRSRLEHAGADLAAHADAARAAGLKCQADYQALTAPK